MKKIEVANYENMKISNELLDYVADADFHTKLKGVEYSTDLRGIVTVGYMVDRKKSTNCCSS